MYLAESVFLSRGTGWVAAPSRLALKISPNPKINRTAFTTTSTRTCLLMHVDYRTVASLLRICCQGRKLLCGHELVGVKIFLGWDRERWAAMTKMGFPPHFDGEMPHMAGEGDARNWRNRRSRCLSWRHSFCDAKECALSSQEWVICLSRKANARHRHSRNRTASKDLPDRWLVASYVPFPRLHR